MDSISNFKPTKVKFVEQTIFYRILLLAAIIAYVLSSTADIFLNLGYRVFILPSSVIAFLLFSVFVLSFFVDTVVNHFALLMKIIAAGIMIHLVGLSVLNHFREEMLIALTISAFVASFVFRRIKILVMFDIAVCAILLCGIFIDQYFTNQLTLLKANVVKPLIDPLFFLLSLIGTMIFAALLSTIRAVQFKNGEEKHGVSWTEKSEPYILVNTFSGKIVDSNDAAALLFQYPSKNDLVNTGFDNLVKGTTAAEIINSLNEQWNSKDIAVTIADFIGQKGKTFKGLIKSLRPDKDEVILHLEITELPQQIIEEKKTESSFESVPEVSKETALFSIVDSILPVASIGLDYRFVKASDSFCELTGYSELELKNIKLTDIIHPEDKDTEKKILSNLFRGSIPASRKEKRIIRKNNQVIWVTASSTILKDENGYPQFVMTVMENIHRQKRQERSLIKDKLNLSSVLDNADIYAITVDRNHTIIYINEPFKDILFGLTDIVVESGFNIKQIIPSPYLNRYVQIFERGIRGEEFSTDEVIEVIGSGKIDIELSVHPVRDEDKNVINLTLAAKNITERKKKERELTQAREEAEAATEAKAGFLATMSHEIRTPLTGVIGMGKLLNQTTLSPKQQEYVDSILLSGEALLSVINDILDFSKIESAKMELEHRPVSLKQIISDALELMSSKAVEKNLALEYSIQRSIPRYVMGDVTRLRQVLLNLVSNAIKFTMKGKISVHASIIRQEGENMQVLFEVRDTGVGIPHEKRDKLFKSFSQLDSSTAKIYGGTGLGLAISKNLVTLMGGKIWVESESGKGSSFMFTMETTSTPKEEIPQMKGGASQLSRANVLILSEDKSEERIYTDYFQRWGTKVTTTSDSKQAIQWIKEGRKFNLVAIDSQLVTAHSMIVASQIRNYIAKEELPIILFNVEETTDITVEFTDKIISALIPKNIDRSKLLDVLIGVFSLEEHQQSRQDKALSGFGKQLATEIPLRILVAEDNAINQKLAQNMFEGLGYKPDMVSNGLEVIEKLRIKEYDMIFMDVQMPELGGLETTKYILQKLKLSMRPFIIAMTAFALEGDREKCIEAGMDDYISKPFLIEEIVQKIKQWGKKSNDTGIREIEFPESTKPLLDASYIERLKVMGGEDGENFMKDVLNMFVNQSKSIVESISNYCRQERSEEMGQAAHKLKGSAINIGAIALADVCKRIEIKGRIGKAEGCENLSQELINVFERTVVEIRKIV
jgi:PAS domain S-box-containing protein